MIILEQIKLPIGHSKEDLDKTVFKRLGLKKSEKINYSILRRSVDARKKPQIFFVYSVGIEKSKKFPMADKKFIKTSDENPYFFPFKAPTDLKKIKRPVIAGFGPAGMFAALELAEAGFAPIILERGKSITERISDVENYWNKGNLNCESNVQFGEGGAGTFSDGKLNTGIGSRQGRQSEVLKIFVKYGAPEKILYENKPHIGTDILRKVVENIREAIKSKGGEILFSSRFEKILQDSEGNVSGCIYSDLKSGGKKEISCKNICIAIGHSARDTFTALYKDGVKMEKKSFAVGIRIEHPQELINKSLYGDIGDSYIKKGVLPVADYKLTGKTHDNRGVYSFCMCPGGYVVSSSSQNDCIAVNGMSYSGRNSENANAAIIVTVTETDFGKDIFAGMNFQKELERRAYMQGNKKIPLQLLADFKNNKVSDGLGSVRPQIKGKWQFSNLRSILPDFISNSIIEVMPEFDKRIKGYNMDDAILSGVETRTSSPIRILRDENGMSNIKGMFPCGEGAGYAGGITSSAVDGIKTAELMAQKILQE